MQVGPDKDALQKEYERLGGYWSDISTWYNLSGKVAGTEWVVSGKFDEFYDRLMGAAASLDLKDPDPATLQEWATAQEQNDAWDQLVMERFGGDIMTVMKEYWNASTAGRRALIKSDPRISQYYDTGDNYAEMFPIWAKYYTEGTSTGGSSGKSTGTGYSKTGKRYYSSGKGGGGYTTYRKYSSGGRSSGGGSVDYTSTIPLGYRTNMEASANLAKAGTGQYGGYIQFPNYVLATLTPTAQAEVTTFVEQGPGTIISGTTVNELLDASAQFPEIAPVVAQMVG